MNQIDDQSARKRLRAIIARIHAIIEIAEHEYMSAGTDGMVIYERKLEMVRCVRLLSRHYHNMQGMYSAACNVATVETCPELLALIDRLVNPLERLDYLCSIFDALASQIIIEFKSEQCVQLAESLRELAASGRAAECDWNNTETRRAYIESMSERELRDRMLRLWSELLFVRGAWRIHLLPIDDDANSDFSRGMRRGRQHCIDGLGLVLEWIEQPLGENGRPVEKITA